jgi:hypothetical protein
VLLAIGVLGNVALLVYVIKDDPYSLVWCAALIAVGVLLYVIEYFFGTRTAAGQQDRTSEEI